MRISAISRPKNDFEGWPDACYDSEVPGSTFRLKRFLNDGALLSPKASETTGDFFFLAGFSLCTSI